MDPFSRKLFKNPDARQRLSQMGGIVASSPELASTVQRFQVGGDVTGLPPATPAEEVLRPSGHQRWFLQGRNQRRQFPGRKQLSDAVPRPDANHEFFQPGGALSDLGQLAARSGSVAINTVPAAAAMVNTAINPVVRYATGYEFPVPEFNLSGTPNAPTGGPSAEAIASAEEAAALRDELGITESLRTPEDQREAAEAARDALTTLRPPARPERDALPDDPMAEAADTTANELRQVFGVPSPDRAPKNRRERVEQELDLIKEVFGHRNKDEARERAMNLAMIGLAIAAGQSPNALTNIAQGALAGTQAMQRAQGAEREREDALRMQAYESVLGEEREDRQFERQKELAEFRVGLAGPAGSGTTTPTDPGNLFATELNKVLGAGLDTPIGLRIAEIEDPAEKEAFALETALENVLTVSPAASEADVARLREVEQRVRERIGRLRGADAGSLSPAQVVTLDAARQSLERNPANRAAIESRLRSVGIDPSLL